MFDTPQRKKLTNLLLSSLVRHLTLSQVQSSSPAHSAATLSQTHPRLCQLPMCFHLVWLYGSFFSFQLPLWTAHQFVLLHLNTCFKVFITAFGPSSQTHPIALHMHSAITSDKNGNFIFVPILLATSLLHNSLPTSHLLHFFNRIDQVSHLLILSIVARLQDEFSLPKQKTL